MSLNIMSWNVRGIMSSAYSLSCLLDENDIDIALLSEHKLFNYSSEFLKSINTKYDYVSVEQSYDNPYSKAKCGQGGVAIMFKKSLSGRIAHIDHIKNERILGIELKPTEKEYESVYVFSIYLPAQNNITDYRDTISELEAISSFYLKEGNLVVGGDCNAQILSSRVTHGSLYKSRAFTDFLNSLNLISVNMSNIKNGPDYTFCPNKTMLDHILINEGYFSEVIQCYILTEDKILTSDHLPIVIRLTANYRNDTPEPENKLIHEKCISWHKITSNHIEQYQSQLNTILMDKLNPNDFNQDNISHIITNAMHVAADKTLPKSKFNKFTKPYWTKEVKEAHTISRNLRRIWINENRPRGRQYQSYLNYKNAKANFRKLQRQESERYYDKIYSDLDEAAGLDFRLFWKMLRNKKQKSKVTCSKIVVGNQTYTPEANVPNGFAIYFQNIFNYENDHPSTTFDNYIQLKLSEFKAYGDKLYDLEKNIECDEISKVISSSLKRRKAPGCDSVLNEHLIYGGYPVINALTVLFNTIIKTEQYPSSWKTSIIIPVYKGHGKSKSEPNSYRPVSLIPSVCKVFEKILVNRLNKYVMSKSQIFPNPQQQGFQEKLSCITASFNVQETILSCLETKNNVYMAQLDIKGAFDTVWHDALFYKLGKLQIVGKIWRLITNSYKNLNCTIRINGTTSDTVDILRGTRQGGVMSSFLYLVYLNDLLIELENSGLGAKVGTVECGNPTLADDICLITTSPANLQSMINIVYNYAKQFKFEISILKSSVMAFSYRRETLPVHIMYDKEIIKKVESTEHLGIITTDNMKNEQRITQRCQKGKNAFHAMIGYGVHPNGLSPITSTSLYNKIVKPTILYGSELWNSMTVKDIANINKLQHYIVKSIQGFHVRTRSDMCESMLGLFRLSSEIDKRKLMFIYKILSLPSHTVSKNIFLRRYFTYISHSNNNARGFIPDICKLLLKYNLEYIINTFILSQKLPTKYEWKKVVKIKVSQLEHSLWQERLGENDFTRFKGLQTGIFPAVIWSKTTDRHDLSKRRQVAQLWVKVPNTLVSVCPLCEQVLRDKLRHGLAECPSTETTRQTFITDLCDRFNNVAYDDVHNMDSEQFTQLALGACFAINLTDPDEQNSYLSMSVNYVTRCVTCYDNEIALNH